MARVWVLRCLFRRPKFSVQPRRAWGSATASAISMVPAQQQVLVDLYTLRTSHCTSMCPYSMHVLYVHTMQRCREGCCRTFHTWHHLVGLGSIRALLQSVDKLSWQMLKGGQKSKGALVM